MSPIHDFPAEFKGDLITPDHPDYPKAISRWALNAKRNAAMVAFVKDTEDISLAIKYACAHGLEIAIKGGGHNPAGASSTEGGLVIDLHRYLNYSRVDPAKRIGYVGGGAVWETVDKAAIEHGLATVGGTVNHTGVAGLTLGGGYGFLSPTHGLALDNVLGVSLPQLLAQTHCLFLPPQATVVLANGSIVTANETENPDLFWGIRGGGSNFGVVAEFVFRLHPQRRTVFAGRALYHRRQLEALISATAEWWDSPGDRSAQIQAATVGPDGQPAMAVIMFYNGSEAEGRAFYHRFFDIGPVLDQVKEIPYEDVNSLQNASLYHGQGVYFKGAAHRRPDYETVLRAFDRAAALNAGPGPNPRVIFEYYPLQRITSHDSGETPFRRDCIPSALVVALWGEDTQENSTRGREMVYELIGLLKDANPQLSEEEKAGYSNYDDDAVSKGAAEKARLVFGKHYARLQEVKKRYDPENVFHKWFPITPGA
ncbi:uncharacterized protein C8Q71DRAFT_58980 [Rhodofomes roseus]|uniref:FAD-binding PCMH-type domain-containing protein n=1 Tax=Rhodofomes roseus TaxID=34475 RepID=A0ABQ8KH71_9APHY|nr:uncharacterized protein C8Q71DRAFT_58980 [Rhodofomes roseus]KAH9836777.1 hypothetical protein C8Q71DRAFT_58980 [Rhodofomes roseus]